MAELADEKWDLLDFECEALYFDEAPGHAVAGLLETARKASDARTAERLLLQAHLLAPDNLMVMVALYRFFYFQHRYGQALVIADDAMAVAGRKLGLPADWRRLDHETARAAGRKDMALLRFYLWALKGRGYLLMRLGRIGEAVEPLEMLCGLDPDDRFGGRVLLALAREKAV